jgi:glucosylceramidase
VRAPAPTHTRRVASTVDGTIHDVAFRNPDGSLVLVLVNDDWGTGSQAFNVRIGGRAFSCELAAGAVATLTVD